MGKDQIGSLNGSFIVLFNFAGVPVRMRIKINSPFLTNLEIVSKGSGNLKVRDEFNVEQTSTHLENAEAIDPCGAGDQALNENPSQRDKASIDRRPEQATPEECHRRPSYS